MKMKLILILLLMNCSFVISAQSHIPNPNDSIMEMSLEQLMTLNVIDKRVNIMIISKGNIEFTLQINGDQQNLKPLSQIMVEGLSGEIFIELFIHKSKVSKVTKRVVLTPGKDSSFVLEKNKYGGYSLRTL